MGEVGGAVDRIEHPAGAGGNLAAAAHFLGEYGVVGKALGDQLAEHAFDRDVDFGDEVDDALLVDLKCLPEAGHHHRTGTLDDFDRSREERRIERHALRRWRNCERRAGNA
jgi:hypothetical protein